MTKYRGVLCSENLCDRPAKSNGYCLRHYNERYDKWRKTQKCKVRNCAKPVSGRGMCSMHYNRVRKFGTTELFVAPKVVQPCRHVSCLDVGIGRRDLCQAHYIEYRKKGYTTDKASGVCESCGQPATKGKRKFRFCKDCRQRSHQLKHGLSRPQIESIEEHQEFRCAMCRKASTLVIDHDHTCCPGSFSCGKCVRAMLCNTCNAGIGYLQDAPELLLIGAYYVQSHRHADLQVGDIHKQLIFLLRSLESTHRKVHPLDLAHLRTETATATERNTDGV